MTQWGIIKGGSNSCKNISNAEMTPPQLKRANVTDDYRGRCIPAKRRESRRTPSCITISAATANATALLKGRPPFTQNKWVAPIFQQLQSVPMHFPAFNPQSQCEDIAVPKEKYMKTGGEELLALHAFAASRATQKVASSSIVCVSRFPLFSSTEEPPLVAQWDGGSAGSATLNQAACL
jgi:hypothetical protein